MHTTCVVLSCKCVAILRGGGGAEMPPKLMLQDEEKHVLDAFRRHDLTLGK